MKSKNYPYKEVLYPILVAEWIYLYLTGVSSFNGVILGVSWTVFCAWQVITCYRKNVIWLMLVWVFMLMYCTEPIRYFAYGEQIAFRSQAENPLTVYQVALTGFLFNMTLAFFTRLKVAKVPDFDYGNKGFENMIWLVCLCASLLMWHFGKQGETILESGGYKRGHTTISTMYGYTIIPLTLALRYSGSKLRRYIVCFVALLFVVKDLMFGGRIDSIMLVIAFYIVYFHRVIERKTMLYILFCGMVLNQAFELVRGAIYKHSFQDALLSGVSNFSLSSGNTQEVYYASMRIFYMINNGFLSLHDRLESLLYFVCSIFVPYSNLPDVSNLSSYAVTKYSTGGGGLVVSFLYAWGGILGIIFVGAFLGRLISYLIRMKCRVFGYWYTVFVIATIPRWYAYYPVQLIKLCVYGAVCAVLLDFLRTKKFNKRIH